MNKVAVTGGLSTGKSSVCRILKRLGAYVVSADEIVHQLLSPHTRIGHQVLSLLGPEILKEGQFDRAAIAAIVFAQPDKLKLLEKILHPAVLDAIDVVYAQVLAEGHYPLFVAEVPLLYESDGQHQFDAVVAVVSSREAAQKRFLSQKSTPTEEFDRRMANQLDPYAKAARADYTLHNDGTLADLEANVQTLYQSLI